MMDMIIEIDNPFLTPCRMWKDKDNMVINSLDTHLSLNICGISTLYLTT